VITGNFFKKLALIAISDARHFWLMLWGDPQSRDHPIRPDEPEAAYGTERAYLLAKEAAFKPVLHYIDDFPRCRAA
jgi:hypothetical protein